MKKKTPKATPAKGISIELYPECEKPDWLEFGAWCNCWGEGLDVYTVDAIRERSAFLMKGKYGHGWESFTKLHRKFPPGYQG